MIIQWRGEEHPIRQVLAKPGSYEYFMTLLGSLMLMFVQTLVGICRNMRFKVRSTAIFFPIRFWCLLLLIVFLVTFDKDVM